MTNYESENGIAPVVLIISVFMISALSLYAISFVIVPLSLSFHVPISFITAAVSISWVSGSLGGLVLGRISDRIGRKKALLYSIVIFSVSLLLNYFISALFELYILWALIGFGVNGENGISYTLVAEYGSKKRRGLTGGIMQGTYSAGALLAAVASGIIAVNVKPDAWKLYFLICGIIALASIAMWSGIPESKVWLRSNRASRENRIQGIGIWSKEMIKVTVMGSILAIASFLFLIPTIVLMPTYLFKAGFSEGEAAMFISSALGISIVGYTVSGLLSDSIGRRYTAMIFSACAVVSSVIFASTFFLLSGTSTFRIMTFVSLSLILFFSAFFADFGVWMSELYPTHIRASGTNTTLLFGRLIGGGLGPLMITILPISLGSGLSVVLIICSIVSLASIIILPEGKRV